MSVEIIAAIIGASAVIIAAVIPVVVKIHKKTTNSEIDNKEEIDEMSHEKNSFLNNSISGEGNVIGNNNNVEINKHVIIQGNEEAKIHIVSIDFIEDNGCFIDIKLRNSGNKVAFISKIGFIIKDYYVMKNPQITNYQLIKPTADYDAVLNSEKKQFFSLSQAINGDDVDRFRIRIANNLCEARMVTIYYFSIVLYYNENKQVASEDYVAAFPSSIEWAGCYVSHFSLEIAKHNYLQMKRINEYSCTKSNTYKKIFESYEKNKQDFL